MDAILDLPPLWFLNGNTEVLINVFPLFLQEFYDEWPVKLGDVPPYSGPKTPDGRVSIHFPLIWFSQSTLLFSLLPSLLHNHSQWMLFCASAGSHLLQDHRLSLRRTQRGNQSHTVNTSSFLLEIMNYYYYALWMNKNLSLTLLLSPSVPCRGPPIDHWALVSGLPTYVSENGYVSWCEKVHVVHTLTTDDILSTSM